jgi:hypothetical protein
MRRCNPLRIRRPKTWYVSARFWCCRIGVPYDNGVTTTPFLGIAASVALSMRRCAMTSSGGV